jgi:AraC family transcriptional regulator of adaptative response/methylated-DNA-[protein]-cysteine methyltransferase
LPQNASPNADPRWALLAARDPAADGQFWYGVSSTGVYCRPSCPSRAAKPANVTFFDSLEQARHAGFRPCRRCNPDGLALAQQHAALVEQACRLIEAAEELPSLATLADAVEISPAHFHRLFKAHTGLTPRAYGQAVRTRRAREALSEGASVTHALHGAGYGSSSRFYAEDALGMAPAAIVRAVWASACISPLANPTSARCWSPAAPKAWPRSCWATMPKSCSTPCKTAFPRPN